MSIVSVLREECIERVGGILTKKEVLKTIAGLAKKCSLLDTTDEDFIFEALKKREEIASTGFENGIAIPHCFLDDLEDFVIGILVAPDGVDFDSLDKEKTKLFIFIMGPESERNRHIEYLSNISHTLRVPEVINELLNESDPSAIRESFLRHSGINTEDAEDTHHCLFYVFIQKEEIFQPVLEIFCAMNVQGLSVIEANDANTYLYSLPLFASILSDHRKGYNRIIVGVVKKSLSNEIIRQIDLAVNGLNKNEGVMVAVQECSVVAGSMIIQ